MGGIYYCLDTGDIPSNHHFRRWSGACTLSHPSSTALQHPVTIACLAFPLLQSTRPHPLRTPTMALTPSTSSSSPPPAAHASGCSRGSSTCPCSRPPARSQTAKLDSSAYPRKQHHITQGGSIAYLSHPLLIRVAGGWVLLLGARLALRVRGLAAGVCWGGHCYRG